MFVKIILAGQEYAFTRKKVLVHYDPKLPIHLAGDASAYGMGQSSLMFIQMVLNAQLFIVQQHSPG